jgi:hypothetical protein
LVEGSGAVHGRGQAVSLVHCLDHLGEGKQEGRFKMRSEAR